MSRIPTGNRSLELTRRTKVVRILKGLLDARKRSQVKAYDTKLSFRSTDSWIEPQQLEVGGVQALVCVCEKKMRSLSVIE